MFYNDKKRICFDIPKDCRHNSYNVTISFTTSPLSEYVGSHIYQLLGYTAHNTMLGYYFNKELCKKQIVVACEDFTENDKYSLVDYESIKNNYSDELQNELIKLNDSLPKYKSSGISQQHQQSFFGFPLHFADDHTR